MRKLIGTVIAIMVISLALCSTPSVEAQPLPFDESEPDGALGAINPSHRVSDSPWLQLPEELWDVPPLLPSRPQGGGEAADRDPRTIEMYDLTTGAVTRIPPSSRTPEPGTVSGLQSTILGAATCRHDRFRVDSPARWSDSSLANDELPMANRGQAVRVFRGRCGGGVLRIHHRLR